MFTGKDGSGYLFTRNNHLMQLYRIEPTDHATRTAMGFSLAELKAVYNALAIDLATGAAATPGGVDLAALLDRIAATINATQATA